MALRTQLRSRLRSKDAANVAWTLGVSIAETLESCRNTGDKIEIVFDTADAPPSYGDFFNVAMIARFLGASGLEVVFRIRDEGPRRIDWLDLDASAQDEHVHECERLAKVLLAGVAQVERTGRSPLDDSSTLRTPLEGHAVPAYVLSQTLFHLLLNVRRWELPRTFLLTPRDFPEPTLRPVGPYVAWHVRRGVWDRGRDTTAGNVVADIKELRSLFPHHTVMLFSSPIGIDFATDQLSRSRDGIDGVVTQPVQGFLAAAPYVLSSDFYFQRRGGGLSQIAIFSHLPYLILNDHASYYYFRQGDRFVPWATRGQQYVIRRGVSRVRIASVVEH